MFSRLFSKERYKFGTDGAPHRQATLTGKRRGAQGENSALAEVDAAVPDLDFPAEILDLEGGPAEIGLEGYGFREIVQHIPEGWNPAIRRLECGFISGPGGLDGR